MTISDKPQHAPANYAELAPCVDVSDQAPWGLPCYVGSGVPLREHPFRPQEEFHNLGAHCGACGSENTLCIYLDFVGSLGTGKDMNVELVCLDCGMYTVDIYID